MVYRHLTFLCFAILIVVTPTKTQGVVYQDAENYCRDGWNYLQQGDYDAAIEAFTKAIQLKSDYSEAYEGRGLAYIYLQAPVSGRGSRFLYGY